MSWIERIGQRTDWTRRVDIRLGLTLAGIYGPLVAAVLFALYAFAAAELLELAEREVDERVSQLEAALQAPAPDHRAIQLELLGEQLDRDAGGFVVRNEAGQIVLSGGRSVPAERGAQSGMALLRAVRTTREDYLRGRRRISPDATLDVFLGSAGFVQERDEIQRGFWITLAVGIVLVAAVSIPATRRALSPLRRATRTAEAMDVTQLDGRLPSRGTHDDIDRHSEVVNRLLDRIESGFARIQSFSQDVAHELRTPVNHILNVTEIALLEPGGSDLGRGELQSIRDSAEQMAWIVDNLLLLARSEDGRLAIRRERVEIPDLCDRLCEMYEPACTELGIGLEVSADKGTVVGDPALLLRMVANLVDNAMAHTPPGGSIRLTTSLDDRSGQWVEIDVADTGGGIPPADRERIFHRFVRLQDSRGERRVGLGLAITRSLARAHGGDARVRETNGPGSCFVVRIPAA